MSRRLGSAGFTAASLLVTLEPLLTLSSLRGRGGGCAQGDRFTRISAAVHKPRLGKLAISSGAQGRGSVRGDMPQIPPFQPTERAHGSSYACLYQPDIPQNAGTMLRTCACLGVAAAIIGPAGFPISDRDFRRAGMDYLDHVTIDRHASFAAFQAWRATCSRAGEPRRLLLLSTRADVSYLDCAYQHGDVLLVGGNPPARRTRSTPPPIWRCAFPCAKACARSTSPWPRRWPWARRCDSCARFDQVRRRTARDEITLQFGIHRASLRRC